MQIEEGSIDLVHFFDGEHGYYYSQCLATEHCRIIATYHQPPSIIRNRRLLGSGTHLRHLDRIIILSESQRSFFNDFTQSDRIVCIPHGVDTDYYIPGRKEKKTGRVFRCLTVGFWLRDLQMILETANALIDREDILFQMVGLKAGVENGSVDLGRYRALKELNNIAFYDGVSDEKLLSLYQEADVLLLPLIESTANNVLLEGLSCGLPIITSDIPATREYLTEDCAFFCSTSNTRNFRDTILALKKNRSRRSLMGFSARNLAETAYNWSKITGQYMELYYSLTK